MSESEAGTATRVQQTTPEHINQAIRRRIEASICYYSQRLDQIDDRLREMEKEWDIERTLEFNAAALSMTGIVLSLRHSRWLLLPAVVAYFLMQHAVQGWCPPVSLFRRLGMRTMAEINQERYGLKALRGDFGGLEGHSNEERLANATRAAEAARPTAA